MSDVLFERDGLPSTGVEYTLWLMPKNEFSTYAVNLTQNLLLGENIAKVKANKGFLFSQGDYLNFKGKIIMARKTTYIDTVETDLPIYSNYIDIDMNSRTITNGLIPVVSDATSSQDVTNNVVSTFNRDTGIWGYKLITNRDSEISFSGAMISSDRILQYYDRRLQYYLEFRNLIYAQTRLGTYQGIVEGVLSTNNDRMITLEGKLLQNTRFRQWQVIGEDLNPTYCPLRIDYSTNFYPKRIKTYATYCPLDTSIFNS